MCRLPVLTTEDIRPLIAPDAVLEVVQAAYADYGNYGAVLSDPPALKLSAVQPGALVFRVKGAHAVGAAVAGFRVLASGGDGASATHCILFDVNSGAMLGAVEETWLHRVRTAATAVAAARWLARQDSRIVAIIGAGRIADELPSLLAHAMPVDELRVASRKQESAFAFANRHKNVLPVRAVSSINEAVSGADVVISITVSRETLIQERHIAPGMTFIALGGGPEVSVGAFRRADTFIVDELEYACMQGSVAGWLKAGVPRMEVESKLSANIGAVAIGSHPGRKSSGETVLAVIQGMACCDVALAEHVLRRATSE